MTRRFRTAVAWLLLFSTAPFSLPLLPPRAAAQKLLPVEQHEVAVKIVAGYLAGGLELPDSLLKQCGFDPFVDAEAWSRFPAASKIEKAYHSAEAAAPRGGGEVWLALLAQELARRYESAAREPLLRRLLSGGKVGCPNFAPQQPPYGSRLSARHKAIVNKLASYCGAAATGYIADAVARHLQIPFPHARAIFTRHRQDMQSSLAMAFELVPEEFRTTRALAFVEHIASNYAALREDPEVRALFRAHLLAPHPTPPPTTAGANALVKDSAETTQTTQPDKPPVDYAAGESFPTTPGASHGIFSPAPEVRDPYVVVPGVGTGPYPPLTTPQPWDPGRSLTVDRPVLITPPGGLSPREEFERRVGVRPPSQPAVVAPPAPAVPREPAATSRPEWPQRREPLISPAEAVRRFPREREAQAVRPPAQPRRAPAAPAAGPKGQACP